MMVLDVVQYHAILVCDYSIDSYCCFVPTGSCHSIQHGTSGDHKDDVETEVL